MPAPYNAENKGSYVIIAIDEDISADNASALAQQILEHLPTHAYKPGTGIILDLRAKHTLDHYFFVETGSAAKIAKNAGSSIVIINGNAQTIRAIKEKGMDTLFPTALSLDKALGTLDIEVPKNPVKIDVAFVNPFIAGTIETLKVQCSTVVNPGKPYVKGRDEVQNIAIAAILGLISKPFSGSIAVCFSEKVFLAIMGRMLGETFTEVTKDLEDGAAELLNIIFGQAKKALNEKHYAIEKAIPSVVRGEGLRMRHSTTSPTIILPFETEHGSFCIEVSTEEKPLK